MEQLLTPVELARDTDRWTEIMLRALSARVAKRWRFVSFSEKRESRMAWRGGCPSCSKEYLCAQHALLKRGDLLDIILIQMKAVRPDCRAWMNRTGFELAKYYRAQEVVLFNWERWQTNIVLHLEPGPQMASQHISIDIWVRECE